MTNEAETGNGSRHPHTACTRGPQGDRPVHRPGKPGPLRRARFLDSIEQKLGLHATQPEMGERRPDLGEEVRHFAAGRYVVFYRPTEAGIEVLRVLHGSRDIPSVWRSRER